MKLFKQFPKNIKVGQKVQVLGVESTSTITEFIHQRQWIKLDNFEGHFPAESVKIVEKSKHEFKARALACAILKDGEFLDFVLDSIEQCHNFGDVWDFIAACAEVFNDQKNKGR